MSFALDLSKFAEKTSKRADQVVRSIVMQCARDVVRMSPVGNPDLWTAEFKAAAVKLGWIPAHGYVGGRFRGNWDYGFNVSPSATFNTIDRTGQTSIDRIEGKLGAMAGHSHYLTNNLPYAMRLEEGYSNQTPHGMVRLTAMKFQTIVDNAARAV